jgi:hypothetical protein
MSEMIRGETNASGARTNMAQAWIALAEKAQRMAGGPF